MAKALPTLTVILFLCGVVSAAQDFGSVSLTPRTQSDAVAAAKRPADVTLTVPAKTEAAVQLLSGIHTQVSHVDDPVRAELVQPVYVNGRVALPPGSLLDGHITRIRSAGRLGRSAQLALHFDTITLPDGQEQPITAILTALDDATARKARVNSEGHVKGPGTSAWRKIAGGLVALGAVSTAGVSIAGTTALATILPVGGTAVFSYAVIFPRGGEVHIPPDTRLRVCLKNDLTVRVHW